MTDPFDPTTDEDDLLAVSALLDGTASDEDAARVAADPALRALLDDLRAVRAELVDVPVPSPATRDAAIAGALAVFDDLHAPTAGISTPAASGAGDVVRFERRRRWYGMVTGAAAAAVAVLFVGALVSGGLGGDDEDRSTAADSAAAPTETFAAAPEAAPAPADAMTEMSAMSETAGAGETADGSDDTLREPATGAATETEMSDVTEAPASEENGDAPDATVAAAGTLGDDATPSEGTIDSLDGAADVVSITSPEQLLDYARGRRAVLPLPGLGFPCVDDGMEAIGEVTYQGVQSVVVRDPSTGTVTAYDLRGSCAVVASVEP